MAIAAEVRHHAKPVRRRARLERTFAAIYLFKYIDRAALSC
jgi:hypothetical protein